MGSSCDLERGKRGNRRRQEIENAVMVRPSGAYAKGLWPQKLDHLTTLASRKEKEEDVQ